MAFRFLRCFWFRYFKFVKVRNWFFHPISHWWWYKPWWCCRSTCSSLFSWYPQQWCICEGTSSSTFTDYKTLSNARCFSPLSWKTSSRLRSYHAFIIYIGNHTLKIYRMPPLIFFRLLFYSNLFIYLGERIFKMVFWILFKFLGKFLAFFVIIEMTHIHFLLL